MATADLADLDPVAVVLAWLTGHPQITDLLGGPEHVSGIPESPWPHLWIGDGPGGDLRDLLWSCELEVELHLRAAPDGAPGMAAMRRTLIKLAQLVKELPEQESKPGEVVVTRVKPSGVLVYSPQSNGQPEWILGLLVTLTPPSS